MAKAKLVWTDKSKGEYRAEVERLEKEIKNIRKMRKRIQKAIKLFERS